MHGVRVETGCIGSSSTRLWIVHQSAPDQGCDGPPDDISSTLRSARCETSSSANLVRLALHGLGHLVIRPDPVLLKPESTAAR